MAEAAEDHEHKRSWRQRFRATSAHNQANIVFSAVIMISTLAYSGIAWRQLSVMRQAATDSGTQTKQLIDAANINACAARTIADASKRNATAAESFATNAGNINEGLEKAVKKLEDTRKTAEAQSEKSLAIARNSFRQDERAWIAPRSAYLTSAVEFGKPIKFNVQYGNVGKQPATEVRPSYTIKPIDKARWDDDTFNALIESDNPCAGKNLAQGAGVSHPNVPEGEILQFATDGPSWMLSPNIVRGTQAMVFEMCVTYKTVNEIHHTSFCYFYLKGVTQTAQLNTCFAGNHAD
jgi:hypothetical protein